MPTVPIAENISNSTSGASSSGCIKQIKTAATIARRRLITITLLAFRISSSSSLRLKIFTPLLPLEFKMKDGVKKRILRDIVYKYVPRELMDRPKTGFMMPVDGWLRTDLRYLLDDNINESELDDSLFDVHSVMAIKNLYLNDRLKHENKVIWRLLMFQMWKKENM